ncbi:Ppx/GppA phosphatase family protein [Thorsellia kenyensis]|uniref:Guanosine-5'-triphosphate,3'-diphosphate pyrophosphatase n=1 Tax=Thorsellia kenyensis TaxID=1549888 RepID=A0ABV6CAH1_9GAMM
MIDIAHMTFQELKENEFFGVIDLGSNSFHLLIARYSEGHLYPVSRLRRKVQLANGLDASFNLSDEAIARGIECIRLFADRIGHFDAKNIKSVATATLRLAENRETFLKQANEILGHKIQVIDGEEEARLIYLGASKSIASVNKPFVFDIGGASTEVIVGDGAEIKFLASLSLGCVTWKQQFFPNDEVNADNFQHAIKAAKKLFETLSPQLINLQWDMVISACGTVQTLNEILLAEKKGPFISRDFLYSLQNKILSIGTIKNLNIKGLFFDKATVLPSGLSILIALFEVFDIEALMPTDGALREGLMYALMKDINDSSIEPKTMIKRIQKHYQVDTAQARRVTNQVEKYLLQCSQLKLQKQIVNLIISGAELHELGLIVGLKNANQHSTYLLNHFPGSGFSSHEKNILALWLQTLHPQKIKAIQFNKQKLMHPKIALILAFLLKLAVLSCVHRIDRLIMPVNVELLNIGKLSFDNSLNDESFDKNIKKAGIQLLVEKAYFKQHPLIQNSLQELIEEVKYDIKIHTKFIE